MKVRLGHLVMTRGVACMIEDQPALGKLISDCISRHANGDWGVTCDEDKKTNDDALKYGGRIISAYTIDPTKGESQGYGDNTLWIITEADRSCTTVLFPEEY